MNRYEIEKMLQDNPVNDGYDVSVICKNNLLIEVLREKGGFNVVYTHVISDAELIKMENQQ